MKTVREHLNLLGMTVEDRVTGYIGVVITIGFDLFGCIQAYVKPKAAGQKTEDGNWFDVKRLRVTRQNRAMELPPFMIDDGNDTAAGRQGAAEKTRYPA